MDATSLNLTFNSNLSQIDHELVCQLAFSFRYNSTIMTLSIFQVVLSYATLHFLYLLFKTKRIRKIWAIIDFDLKIIVAAGVTFYILGSLNVLLLQSYKLATFLLPYDACFYIWDGTQCYIVQYLFNMSCTPAYALFHLVLFIERCYANLKNVKNDVGRKTSGIFGCFMAGMIVFLPVVPPLIVDTKDRFEDPRAYCATPFSWNASWNKAAVFAIIGFEFLWTIMHFVLFLYNKMQVERQKRNMSNFNLLRSFKLRQMQLSISVIYPYSVAHFFTYSLTFYYVIYYVDQFNQFGLVEAMEFVEKMTTIRVFSTLLVILFLYIHNTVYRPKPNVLWPKTDEGDQHFIHINRMFS